MGNRRESKLQSGISDSRSVRLISLKKQIALLRQRKKDEERAIDAQAELERKVAALNEELMKVEAEP
jgi:hypothetical protein